jgi:hypothetical protein
MSLKEDATTVAVLRALRDIIDAEYEAARHRVFAGLREARDEVGLKSMRVTLPDGTPIATVTLNDPRPATVVGDEGAFVAWVADRYPSEIETQVRVRPGWQRKFLSELDPSADQAIDPRTGETVEGLVTIRSSEPRSFSLRPLPDGIREISRAWRCGDLDLYRMLPLGSVQKVTADDSG